MYSMHPFGGLASHPYGGSIGAMQPLDMNQSVSAMTRTSSTAKNINMMNMNLLKQNVAMFNRLRATTPMLRQPLAIPTGEGLLAAGGEPSFFEANKTAILVGGGIAVVLAAVLIMRRK